MSMLESSFVVVPAQLNVDVPAHENVGVLERCLSLFYCMKCDCYSALQRKCSSASIVVVPTHNV